MAHLIAATALFGSAAAACFLYWGMVRLGVREPLLSLVAVALAIGGGFFFLLMTPLWYDLLGM